MMFSPERLDRIDDIIQSKRRCMWLGSYAAWYCKWYRISRVEFSSLILSACSSIHVMLVGVDINWLNEEVM
jgi:hypothetical protein